MQHNEYLRDIIQLWQRVKQEFPETEVTAKQVYAMWETINSSTWKLDPDQLTSARMVLERAAASAIEIIPLRQEKGMSSVAFALKRPLELWGDKTEEIAIDGTCE